MQLPINTMVPSLVSGNTMTAAATCRWVLLQIDNRPNLEIRYINGGTSSVGKAVFLSSH